MSKKDDVRNAIVNKVNKTFMPKRKENKTKQRTQARKRKRLLTAWLTISTTIKRFNNCLTKKDSRKPARNRERESPSIKSTSAQLTSVLIGFFFIRNGGIGRGNEFGPVSKIRSTKGNFCFWNVCNGAKNELKHS